MPELMITPTQTPLPGGAGNTNALGQSDASSRSNESTKADTDGTTGSPFSAVLKSRMDKKPATEDAADSASTSDTAPQANSGNIVVDVDLSALLPFLGINPAAMTVTPGAITGQAGTTIPDDDSRPAVSGLQAAAAPAPAQPVAAAPPMPTTLMDTGSRRQPAQEGNEGGGTADVLKIGAAREPGKIQPEAAINADTGGGKGEVTQSEIPAGDFRALMERAATLNSAAASPANTPSSSPGIRIETPLGQSGWHDEMGQKLTWMVGNNRQQADIVLTPPQLGRVEVSLTMNGDQATAIFTSPNPAVREALEASMHRLREVLADAGVSLGQTQVGSESPNQSSRQDERGLGSAEGVRYASAIPLPAMQATERTGAGRGMVDIFA